MKSRILFAVPLLALFAGCETTSTYVTADTPGKVQGVGMESQDIISMSDKMARDLLAQSNLVSRPTPPRIIIDSEYFRNEGTSRVNKNLITDRLRVDLNRAAQGRLLFVGREFVNAVEAERKLKREGVTDQGTVRSTQATAGVDFRLTGRIATSDAVDPKTGMTQRWTQITFELLDLEYGTIVWSNIYDYAKASQDDIIYR
jgi:hypothetical protein